ncbi:MAG: L-rhamnose isomerase [Firmicutes bacterium ADurb.Bin182]|nr:MAG: L-rhamnose isomerase [Firmicutes bacterium ADurb.Bin182]
MKDNSIQNGLRYAEEKYAEAGVDVNAAAAKADAVSISMHCWQGDDVIGFDGIGALTGGIASTGNYPGRARTAGELRDDIAKALTMIPGRTKLNLHACYAEKNGKNVDRDAYTPDLFDAWVDFATEKGLGLDFNPTFFSHPMMDGNFTLASPKPEVRRFWIEHGKRCREIGLSFSKKLNQPCVVNYWMPDGYKDVCADTFAPRKRMIESLDEIFAAQIDDSLVPCAVESKLFGVGLESYTVASHELSLGYAIRNKKVYCLDAGHFHPTEVISAKITSILCFVDRLLLHVSRGVRWDSDHIVMWDDELQHIMNEIVWNGLTDRVFIGLDYFDASVNRIAAWVIGMRNARKALLWACLVPYEQIRKAEKEGDFTKRLALMENVRTLPFGAVWEAYCANKGIPGDAEWLGIVQSYEREVLSKR